MSEGQPRLYRVAVTGVFTEVQFPGEPLLPTALAWADDGSLWFTSGLTGDNDIDRARP